MASACLHEGCQRNAPIAGMKGRKPYAMVIQWLSVAERLRQSDPDDWLKEIGMADDKTKVGGQDRKRINLNEDYEVRDWAKSLGVTGQELRAAVAAVGDRAEKVREYLRKK